MLLRLTPPSAPPLRRRSHLLRRGVPCQTDLRFPAVRHKPRPLQIRFSSSHPEAGSVDSSSDELEKLLSLLPDEMQQKLVAHPEFHRLIEIVMDLGREPLARFPSGDFLLSNQPITFRDLSHATSQVGDFAADNRAGISRTLHRISAVRNRKGSIVGLTCRVGRAVSGSANSLRELIEGGASLLLIGPPGVGKTTIIRDIARMLADDYQKRVMIVDTSNEIGGDGDIPHPGIGNARRMQVPDANMQHKVLIEAVENHMPQAIIIDEIGTKLEAMAASTIAQRGIQLVASAHGITIENLMMNPSLELLVGGIQSVTLGDEEASRRGVRKTILERKGPSTFACGVEIISKTELRIHRSLEATVDALLAGRSPKVEVRKTTHGLSSENTSLPKGGMDILSHEQEDEAIKEDALSTSDEIISSNFIFENNDSMVSRHPESDEPIRLFIYGILEASVLQAIKQLRMDETIQLTDNISEADAFLALHSKIKKNSRIQAVAKSCEIPIYVTKTCSLEQIAKALRSLVTKHTDGLKHSIEEDEMSSPERLDALEEARLAIERTVIPKGESVELLPRPLNILLPQMELIETYNLKFVKVGKEPNVCLLILPMGHNTTVDIDGDGDAPQQQNASSGEDIDSSNSGISRLPLLPE